MSKPVLVETRDWGSATFVGSRNTFTGVTLPLDEIEDLPLVHSFVTEVHTDHEGNTVIVLISENPEDTSKGVNELVRKLT